MKKSWQTNKLGEVCEIYQPKTISTSEMANTGKYLVYGANGVIGKFDKYNHEESQLLITCRGATCGAINISEPKSWINGNAMVVRPKDHSLNIRFLEYLFRGAIDFSKCISGAAQPQITRQSLSPIEISYPLSLSEQHRIVSILDKEFAAIDKAKINTDKYLQNTNELFNSYLQATFENKEVDWELARVTEVCELKSGTTIPISLERSSGDVLYAKVADMNLPENLIELTSSRRFVNSKEINKRQIIPKGAVVFPKRGGAIATNKKRMIVKPTIVDLNIMAIIPSKKIDKDYLYFWFQLINLSDISNGTSIAQINNYSFDDVFISYPTSIRQQQSIAAKLQSVSSKIGRLESIFLKKLVYLDELKKSILRKTLNG